VDYPTVHSWIPIGRIREIVQLESAIVLLIFSISAWIAYLLFLKRVSVERHRSLKELFKNLFFYLVTGGLFFVSFYLMDHNPPVNPSLSRVTPYLGLVSLFLGAICLVKTFKILAFEYLFINHMQAGVPMLVVNLFTLFISVMIAGWMANSIFDVKLGPLLATSAAFSIILGIALQDTLGNLFAGVSLQFDKPFEIGDWVEVKQNSQKIVGKVHEISWRATVLVSFSDEMITLPNRVMAQAEVSNFSVEDRPFCKTINYYVEYGTPFEKARDAILSSLKKIEEVANQPAPLVLLRELGDSYMTLRLVFSIRDYGRQYIIMSEIHEKSLEALKTVGINIAPPKLQVSAYPKSA